jgi:hypothetical protein
MRFTDNQIHRLAETLLNALVEKGGATLKVERSRVLSRIEEIIRGNLQQEDDLDREAKKILELHLRQAPAGIDQQKMLLMIKKKLAEERGLPL